MNWYEQIEEPVRELVWLLRNNGFNTVSSCGHLKPRPMVQMNWSGSEGEVRRLWELLYENDYTKFEIDCHWCSTGISRFMEVVLY